MELHFKYLEKVRLADAKIEKERNASITPRCTTIFFSKAANLAADFGFHNLLFAFGIMRVRSLRKKGVT